MSWVPELICCICVVAADHYDHRLEDDHWEQPGNLFRKMTPEQKQLLFDNTARAINGASQEVLDRHVANCRRADPAYGDGVARALKEAAHPRG